MFKAVLFDFDGTLVDSLGLYVKAYRATLEHFGFHFDDVKIIKMCFGKTEEAIAQTLGLPNKADEFRRVYFEQLHSRSHEIELFADTRDTLNKLRDKNIKLAIITFLHKEFIEPAIDRLNIRDYFESIISFNDVQNAKPAPDAVYLACEKLDVKESESLVIGDSRSDILMGKNAGSKTALYTSEANKRFYNFLEVITAVHPDYVIQTLSETVSILNPS